VSQSSAPGRSGQEVRLALVLNGGMWMGGVTHEIDLLRRWRRASRRGASAECLSTTGRCSMRGPLSVTPASAVAASSNSGTTRRVAKEGGATASERGGLIVSHLWPPRRSA
jgi:hypothetical protein